MIVDQYMVILNYLKIDPVYRVYVRILGGDLLKSFLQEKINSP